MKKKGSEEMGKLDAFQGQDKLTGRPLKLNIQRLEPNSKGYAELLLFGDLHLGARNCDLNRAKANLDYCLKNHIYIMMMGDMLEAATRYSIGSGVYEQTNPQEQIEEVLELLKPLAEAKLIVGYLNGN